MPSTDKSRVCNTSSLAQGSTHRPQALTMLLSTNQQASPLCEIDTNGRRVGTYTPYGLETALQSCLGFTGQLRAKGLQGYLLGNGYRFYSTILLRFHSPDSLSPFLAGGINCYAYCSGDPVNLSDSTGHQGVRPASRSRSRSPQRVSSPPSSPDVLQQMMDHPGWQSAPSVWDQMMAHPDWPSVPVDTAPNSGALITTTSAPAAASTAGLSIATGGSVPTLGLQRGRRTRPKTIVLSEEDGNRMTSKLESSNVRIGERSFEASRGIVAEAISVRVNDGNIRGALMASPHRLSPVEYHQVITSMYNLRKQTGL